MLFDIEADNGTSIVVYVVPDSGGTTPSLRLRSGGAELITMEANDRRPNLVDAGRHSTGLCGFVIDENAVPGLASYTDLELTEASSNLLVYRRRPPQAIETRVCRLETHLLPLWRFDDSLKRHFQYWYCSIDRFGRETAEQIFCLESNSSFFSGRLLYKNFEHYLTKGVKVVGLIREPYTELAERLVLLKNIGTRAEEVLGARDALTFAPTIAALQDCDLLDETSVKRFFKKAPNEAVVALSNPLIRQLTGGTPEELPGKASVAAALDALASFEVLGLRSSPGEFLKGLADLINIDHLELPTIGEYPRVRELGERLKAIHAIEEFLEKDLEIFQVITHAFKAAEA